MLVQIKDFSLLPRRRATVVPRFHNAAVEVARQVIPHSSYDSHNYKQAGN